MDNQELCRRKEELGLSDFQINYKTGVHYGVIEDFFSGRVEMLEIRDREKIEALIEKEWKKRK